MKGPQATDLGIIAGGGSLPIEIARSVTGRGGRVHVVMIDGEADEGLRNFSHTVVNWAELGRAVRSVKQAGVSDLVMVGRMSRPSLRTARPDLGFLRSLPNILRALRAGGDDAVLRGVVKLLETRGLNVLSVADIAPELLLDDGALGFHGPKPADFGDIAIGMGLVADLGPYDIGQGVVVTAGSVEAIEGAEGTDRMIARVAELRQASGADIMSMRRGVLVKRPKPGQDKRLDLPAIGPETVDGAIRAGLAGIAGLAGEVLAASRFEMIERADRAQLFVAGVRAEETNRPPTEDHLIEPIVFGRLSVPLERAGDVERGVRILGVLGRYDTGSALVVSNGHVLAVGAREPPLDVLNRAAPYVNRKRKSAVLVIGAQEALDETLIRAAAATGISGIVVMFGRGDGPRHKGPILDIADRFGLFIAGAAADPKEAAL